MSHLPLRSEKKCLNCGAEVQDRFCPKCGQENVDVRPSFHHLISHFFADLFHYDSGFWKTMKTLLFKPGVIVNDYLNGKRKTYVEPVKLYIFVSFVAFFLPHFFPNFYDNIEEKKEKYQLSQVRDSLDSLKILTAENILSVQQIDSLQNLLPEEKRLSKEELADLKEQLKNFQNQKGEKSKDDSGFEINLLDAFGSSNADYDGISFGKNYQDVKTLAEFDSIHHALPKEKKMNWLWHSMARKLVDVQEKDVNKSQDFQSKFIETFQKNMPKALFIYLPIFAFTLWFFHSKKKWLYYDHGIFTLYFFSAILIFITSLTILESLLSVPYKWWDGYKQIYETISFILGLALVGYGIFYLFRAHHRVYKNKTWTSRFIVIILLLVISFSLLIVGVIYTIITFMLI